MAARKELVEVMGRRWDTTRPNLFAAPVGLSLEDIVLQSLSKAYRDRVYTKRQYRMLLQYARVRWNGVEVERRNWRRVFPEKGDRIEVLHGVRGGGGGGGGKNPLGTILSVVVMAVAMVATSFVGGTGIFAAGGMLEGMGLGLTGGALFAAQVGIGLATMGMLYAVNALFPASPPKTPSLSGSSSAEKDSPTYSLSGGRNAHNIGGYVPLILGRHRVTPPLGAKSWTVWEGDKQFFNMLVVWGHPDIEVSSFRIGDTALSSFDDVEHHFIQSTTGSGLKYFAKQYNEESVGATLKESEGFVRRTVGEANGISVDIMFPGGLTTINQQNGSKENRTVEVEVQYKPTSGGSWTGFPTTLTKRFGETALQWTQAEMLDKVSVFYRNGGITAVKRGETVSGAVQIWPRPDNMQYTTCSVSCGFEGEPSGAGSYSYGYGYGYGYSTGRGFTAKGFTVTVSAGAFRVGGKNYQIRQALKASMEAPFSIWVTNGGKIQKNSGAAQLWPRKTGRTSGGSVQWARRYSSRIVDWDEWGGAYYDSVFVGWTASVRAGSIEVAGTGRAQFTSAKQKQIVCNLRVEGLELKSWDVRMKRITKDTDDSYIIDECQWATMRAIIDRPAFDTPVPICVSELRIRASEQLSGYVSDFSGICHSRIPDWDDSQQKWVTGLTRNPASIMRYLLTSRHSLAKPFSASRLDNAALVGLWKWCKSNGYTFDYVCDSEEALWPRLVQALSPAMAAPTTDVDGLWGAIWDAPGKTPKQMFTPRNSWNMQIQRGFARLPDALRVSFVDEADDWTQKEGFVYNDGYSKDGANGTKKADDVVEWEFPGVTNWGRMHRLARFHLAQMLHRQTTVTINTDWEWLAVHRGDLVGLASDVLMNTFGTARVICWVYRVSQRYIDDSSDDVILEDVNDDIDDSYAIVKASRTADIPLDRAGNRLNPSGIEIDDTVVYSEGGDNNPVRYGIAVRSETGTLSVVEITPDYGNESSILWFRNRVLDANKPALGSLLSVSILGEEYEEYLVSSIAPGENMSAQLTLIPYKTKEIRAAATGPIPAYEAPVILDVVKSSSLPTPSIVQVRSDESVFVRSEGGIVLRIGAWWKLPATAGGLAYYTVQIEATERSSGMELYGTASSSDEFVAAAGAVVGRTYYVRIRIADPVSGRTSAWSSVVTHKVVGLTARPPVPQNVRAQASYPDGILIRWDEVPVADLDHYRIGGSASGRTKGRECEFMAPAWQKAGVLEYKVWAVDILGNESAKPGSATFRVYPPNAPKLNTAEYGADAVRLENEGIVCRYLDAGVTWPVDSYEWTCRKSAGVSSSLRCVVPHPDDFEGGDAVTGRARDAFGNWGASCAPFAVKIVPPLTPEVEIGVNENGTAAFTWQDCRTYTDIRHYAVSGGCEGTTTGRYAVLDVANILWTTHSELVNGQTVAYRIGAISVAVTAVDKWGFESQPGGGSYVIYPPLDPILELETRTDGLYLEWQDCKTTFLIDRYVVTDSHVEKGYSTRACTQILHPRPAGYYDFSIAAYDVIGNASALVTLSDVYIGGPRPFACTSRIDGSDAVIEWETPVSDFPVELYRIYDASDHLVGRAKASQFRFPAPKAGSYSYSVQAVDSAGNESAQMPVDVTVDAPLAPVFGEDRVSIGAEGVTLRWEAQAGPRTLPVIAWEVRRTTDGAADVSCGRYDANTVTVPPLAAGRHTFWIRAVDSSKNLGPEGSVVFEAKVPGRVTFDGCVSIDNNVMLFWSEPDFIQFPIAYYLFEQVDYTAAGDRVTAEIGRIDARFSSSFESESGEYVYSVTPVDVAGNFGQWSEIRMQVAQPPDFILYANYDSLFNGGNYGDASLQTGRHASGAGRNGFHLDGAGSMIGPYDDRTWNEQLAAMAALEGVSNPSDITWQQKNAWGYERWLAPASGTAVYVEYLDVTGSSNALVPSTKIAVTLESETLDGNPVFSCRIEVSQDGTNWTVMTDNGWMVFATEFQYVRCTITLTGGVAKVRRINYKLDVKRISDFGHVESRADDNDAEYVSDASTPMLKGTWVDFHTDFTDVQSLPRPNVAAVYDENGNEIYGIADIKEYTAYTTFERVIHPRGFRVYVLDKNGSRVTAQVDWSAFGV